MKQSYLALGANIGDAKKNVEGGIDHLRDSRDIEVVTVSRFYANHAVGGPSDQPDFVNCVCKIETSLDARALLEKCLDIERILGRIRAQRWGPRTLDIDILLFGNDIIDVDGLRVPHPSLRHRLFALVPLADIAPKDLKLPPDNKLLIDILNERLAVEKQTLQEWNNKVI